MTRVKTDKNVPPTSQSEIYKADGDYRNLLSKHKAVVFAGVWEKLTLVHLMHAESCKMHFVNAR